MVELIFLKDFYDIEPAYSWILRVFKEYKTCMLVTSGLEGIQIHVHLRKAFEKEYNLNS